MTNPLPSTLAVAFWSLLFLLSLSSRPVFGLTEDKIAAFHSKIASELQAAKIRGAAYAFRGPGMDGPVLGAYGLTASSDDSPPMETDTAFQLASLSKPFTGAAVGTLLEQGLLSSLDDDICNVFNDTGPTLADGSVNTACRNPAYPDIPVTWRMIVTHRSSMVRGLPRAAGDVEVSYGPTGVNYIVEVAGNPTCPIDDVVQFYEDLLVDKDTETTVGQSDGYNVHWYSLAEQDVGGIWNASYPPGQREEYSNVAVGYIAALVEHLTEQAFPDYAQDNVFAVVGMNQTAWFHTDLSNDTIVAMPTYPYDDATESWTDVGHYCWANYADGQLHSSIQDLAAYADLLVDSYGVGTLWSNETAWEYVFGCQAEDETGTRISEQDCEFALSWGYLNNEKKATMGWPHPFEQLDWTNGMVHDGSEFGIATDAFILPEAKSYSIILFSTEGVDVDYFVEGIIHEGMSSLLDMGAPAGSPVVLMVVLWSLFN
ncbi:beta-lactamase [Seminavis robusta]|uniref:Beta-lactamase n=1 Tax=Seminavis robusta TaxID=568900 RepID=A0A9N8DW17_9STRA|nr:beta-lactamase [Seminavis robusta]|eukprot:Sro416_g138610.1 beta-lactamase (484) ;mRNA; f:30037-31800